MTRSTHYADPTRCPDCSGPIAYGDLTCPACGLPLRGDTAARLFQTLTVADSLLDTLRAGARVPAGALTGPRAAGTAGGPAAGAGSPETGVGSPGLGPASPVSVPVRRARGVTATAPAPAGPGSRRYPRRTTA